MEAPFSTEVALGLHSKCGWQLHLAYPHDEGELAMHCRLAGDPSLHSLLATLNEAILSDARQARKQGADSASWQRPGSPVTPLEPDLAQLLAWAGQSNALEQVPGSPLLCVWCGSKIL